MTFLRVPSKLGTKWVVSRSLFTVTSWFPPQGTPMVQKKHGVGELCGGGVQINHTWPVAYSSFVFFMSLPSEGQSLSANQISSRYLNWRDITTSGFEIQTSTIFEFYFRFQSRPFPRNRRVILHPDAEFRPNLNIRRWNMTSDRFSRCRPSAMLYLLWGNGGKPTSDEVPFVVWIPTSNRYSSSD